MNWRWLKSLVLVLVFCLVACGTEGTTGNGDNGNDDDDDDDVSAEVAAVEASVHTQVNQERTDVGLSELTRVTALNTIARAHSQDMIDRSFFSHTNPDGEDPSDRFDEAGISWSSVAENIAQNLGYSDPATEAVEGWMASAGHKENILDENSYGFTQTGIGIAVSSDDTYYFTQVFHTP